MMDDPGTLVRVILSALSLRPKKMIQLKIRIITRGVFFIMVR